MKRLLTAAAITLAVLPAKAEDTSSGNFLLKACQSAVDNGTDWYSGYCLGLVDGLSAETVALGIACIPEQVTKGQIERVVLKYLQDRPQDLNLGAQMLAIKAIGTAWPCPTKKR
jgi:hypothetical protein